MEDAETLPVAGTVVLLRPAAEGGEVLLMRRPTRGSFAGAWVFPGGRVEPVDRREGGAERDDARRAGIRETREEVGLTVDTVTALSVWHPPTEAPTRIRTWFFLATAPDMLPVLSPDEVAEIAWMRPAEALDRHAAGDLLLFPPTWVTLHRLAAGIGIPSEAGSASNAGLSGETPVEEFRTRVVVTAHGRDFAWAQGRLETRTLPWRFLEA